MEKSIKFIMNCFLAIAVSGCVTQNYENDKTTPVVQNESSNNEIAMTRISLGLGYLKMGNTTQAKLNLEKARHYAPKLVQVYTAFAHYYDTVGEPEQAITSYEHALSIKPDDADTLNNYGVFLCKQGQYQAAEKHILKAIAVPSYLLVAQSYENLALCQLEANNFDKAQLYLSKAIDHSPSNASALLHMVTLQYAKADYKSADSYLKRYEKSTRRFSADSLALAYKIFAVQHDEKMAKNYAAMLVKMFPNSFETKQYLLNDLREIEADRLAKRYQATLIAQQAPTKQKRTVKLSPKTKRDSQQSVAKVSEQKAPTASAVEQTQQLPKKSDDSASSVVKPQPASKQEETHTQSMNMPVHVVVKGDSLFSISKKYNIHMKAIERWNGIKRNKVLKIGDVIYLANPKKIAKS